MKSFSTALKKRYIELLCIGVILLPLIFVPASGSGFSTTSRSLVTSPTGFNGLNQTASFGQIAPPDVQIAAGPNHLVEIVNRDVTIYSKTGTLLSHVSLNSFFNTGTDWTFDPRALYDTLSGRWFLAMDDGTLGNIHIAVSNSTVPTGWRFYVVGGSSTRCYDQPRIGVSSDKFVVTADSFGYAPPPPNTACFGSGSDFEQYWVLNKTDMVNGLSFAHNITITSLPSTLNSLQPMQALGNVNTIYLESTGESAPHNVTLVTISGVPPGMVTNSSTTIVLTAPFGSLPVSAPTPAIYSVDLSDGIRMQDVVWFQNKLWSTYMSGCTPTGDSTTRGCIQLLELNTTTSTPTLMQNFDYARKGQYYFYPALNLDGYGNLDMIFGYSNSTTYPGLALTGQAWDDPANTMAARLIIRQGSSICSCGRYGDYFGAAPDPSNPALVWTNGEYYNASGFGGWNTFIASEQLLAPDFAITANPSDLGNHIIAGSRHTITINVTSIRGFGGIVRLSASQVSQVTTSFNPTGVTISSGGFATSKLTIVFGDCPIGSPPLIVTGQSGPFSHTVNITWEGLIIC